LSPIGDGIRNNLINRTKIFIPAESLTMNLCIVTRNVSKGDGQGRANYEIAWEAIRRTHQVAILSSNLDPELREHSQVNWIYIPVKNWPTQLLSSLVFSWRSSAWLRKHRLEIDLIQACGAVTGAATDINTVHFIHSGWLRSPVHPIRLHQGAYGVYQWLYTVLNAHWEKEAFRQAKVVVAVSEKIEKELIEIGVPKDRIRVILNGVNLQEFAPGSADRSQLGLPERVTLALFVGDIRTPRKNLDTVLNALFQVPALHLAVVGATERSPYPSLAIKLGLDKRVHFLGYRRDVSEIMKAVDLFVLPSRYEACTLVLLEAMATGLPVITAVTAGGAEIVTPDCGVVLSDSEDTQALAKALTKLSSDRHLRNQMGQTSRVIAEQHSWNSKAKRYIDLFEATLKR
jgi:glycosyltransferase involved in cell wall biosynthesis